MATASSLNFITFLKKANNPILVADEAHRIGSPKYRELMNVIQFKEKLGLHVTPQQKTHNFVEFFKNLIPNMKTKLDL